MGEETLISIVLVAAFLGIFLVTAVRNHQQQRKVFVNRVKKLWGQASDREYTYEEFQSISHYATRHRGNDFFIDDITWNDLDMDRVFMLLNNTVSSCGEEYLYAMLRRPLFAQEALDERNRLIEFFRKNEAVRIQMQTILAVIGKTRGISIGDYIYRFQDVQKKSILKYVVLLCAMIASIGSFFIEPVIGIAAVCILLFYNTLFHIKEKGEMELYLRCFQCVLKMCSAVSLLEKADIPEVEAYTEKLKSARKALANFSRGSFLVTSKGNVSTDLGAGILEYVNMFFHFDKIKFYSMLKQLDGHQGDIEILMENFGILDSAIAIASFREYLPYYCRGTFGSPGLEVHNLYHPLIEKPVANSITVSKGILVTGSNASGKSTFLKNIAINSILAQTIDTAVATEYKAPFLKVMTSMALNDSLENGESYYIVEIKSLKRILDESKKEVPLLCVIDEVLRGTNTIERIAASSQILKQLNLPHVLPFAATHDLELSHILESGYDNYHFEEEISDDDIQFNYLLKPGRTNTRNAIRLLELMGYDTELIEAARSEAAGFEKTGVWEIC